MNMSEGQDIQSAIVNLLPDDKMYLAGFAAMENLLLPTFDYKYAVVICRKLDDNIIDSISRGPTAEYHSLYEQANAELNALSNKISNLMSKFRIDNLPIKATVEDNELDSNYEKTLRYKFSHKMVATRAGIGWIGKTDLLISRKFGPRIRMASVLTNYKFENIGRPINKSKCGNCNICVANCPAGAANGKLWDIHTDRNEFYDPFKCRAMCRKLSQERINKNISICGICLSLCPIGKKERNKGAG